MTTEIKVPEVGEAVKEALLVQWYRQDGDVVKRDELLFLIETDKVTLEVPSQAGGKLHILVNAGVTVPVGSVVGTLEAVEEATQQMEPPQEVLRKPAAEPSPVPKGTARDVAPVAAPPTQRVSGVAPSVQELLAERGLDPARIKGTGPGGRLTKGDVLLHLEAADEGPATVSTRDTARADVPQSGNLASGEAAASWKTVSPVPAQAPEQQSVIRKPMSRIRMRIAERLLESRRNTAMLTTFNEIDMSRVQEIRAALKESFKKKHGVGLGMMSFFIKAAVEALKAYPEVNAFIEGNEIVYHSYYHVGVAVGAERGLVVPVIRNAERLSFAELEQAIVNYVKKIQENRLEISDMEDGTFTISNGGVYGSLLSTPILNTPQSGILGMHKIEDRPVVVNGQVVVRPMMYVALSYDHRIIDGREAVGFLKHIKECVEQPERILIGI
ncbi:MAG: 2-oxoglutarate dehydrogenase complex dihydrolipoyllysine-residue succinyltransferase [Syntrophobacteraceae bacterium]